MSDSPESTPDALKPPNIILTIADDQRGTALGCAGIEAIQTPHLDQLAARGIRFAQAQHLGSCHGAICAPSRAMLHTGRPYFQLDKNLLGPIRAPGDATFDIPPTLGQKLQQAGYRTFATGKWHNGVDSFHRSFDHGSNVFFGGMADHWFTPVHDFDSTGAYPAAAAKTASGFSTEVFAQSAIDFIQSRKADDQPFFCYCAFTAPHDPRTPPDHWRRRYDPRQIKPFPNMEPVSQPQPTPQGIRPAADAGCLDVRDELLLGNPRDWDEVQRTLAEYYAMVSHMDEWIGRIHAAVDAIGERENTLIIHTADHGLAVGQHGLLGKQNPYQHSLNVPLILAGPEVPVGRTSDALCYQHDLHPTLLDYAGVSEEAGAFRSLSPLLHGSTGIRETLGNAFQDEHRSIRDERYKLIESNVAGARRTRLFDLQEDRWEVRDLSGRAEHQSTIHTLRGQLAQWVNDTGDPVTWLG